MCSVLVRVFMCAKKSCAFICVCVLSHVVVFVFVIFVVRVVFYCVCFCLCVSSFVLCVVVFCV